MTERTIQGIVARYSSESKQRKDRWYRTVHIEGDETSPKFGHQIYASKEVLDTLPDKVPVGSEVTFIEGQNGEYWNYVVPSFRAITIAEKKPEAQKVAPRKSNGESPETLRSICVSYAKDVCIGGKIEKDDIINLAKEFYTYISTGNEGESITEETVQ